MNLSHFTAEHSLVPRSEVQTGRRGDKPVGLWVSVDGPDDWQEWCRSEGWGDVDSKLRFRVTLADDANVLRIDSTSSLLDFAAEFQDPGGRAWRVNWSAVAERWQGIIIAPYQWSCRLGEPDWYYTWDCASGCIWDADAISCVELLDSEVAA